MLMAGLPGTGKSTLAEALQKHTGGVVLNKDHIRAAMFPGSWTDYSAGQDDVAMGALFASLQYLATHAKPAFIYIDGRTFRYRKQLDEAIAVAEKAGCPWKILYLVSEREAIRKRLSQSQHIAQNRTFEFYLELERSFEEILRPALQVDTTQELEQCVSISLNYLHSGS